MQEHPVPQDITGYQFHIIGNMTIKQFAEIGIGCFLGFLTYTTNLPDIIKWPVVALFVALGAGAAFVPIEERPLDHWIITFFQVMYKPTKFYWRKAMKIPDPFLYQPKSLATPQPYQVDLSPARRQRIIDYMSSIHHPQGDPVEMAEQNRVNEILDTFSKVTAKEVQIIKQVEKPALNVRVRDLKSKEERKSEVVFSSAPAMSASLSKKQMAQSSQIARDIDVPTINKVQLTTKQTMEADQNAPAPTAQTQAVPENQVSYMQNATSAVAAPKTESRASFNVELPFPSLPTQPNKPVGMVLTNNNQILPGVIVEIKTPDGVPARAVKTNTLGQFFITTPLQNGNYIIEAEKDGYSFPAQDLLISGDIIQPIEIRGQAMDQPVQLATLA